MLHLFFATICQGASHASTGTKHLKDIFHNMHTEHDDSLIHNHEFHHQDEKTGEFASVRYNATKCAKNHYIVIDDAEKIECFSTDVILVEFKSVLEAEKFFASAKKGSVLMSHHRLRCFENNESVLLRIKEIKPIGDRTFQVSGTEAQPFELFKHVDAEFTTNMLLSNSCSRGAPASKGTMKATSTEEENITTNQADLDSETFVGPWKVHVPSDILWQDPSAARMFCIDCSMHFFPIIKFKIRISNYKLEKLVLVYESTTLLDLEPHVAFDIRESVQTMELLKDYLEDLLKQFRLTFHIGGVPIEIDPGMRLGVFMFSVANIDAHIGYKASLLGSFKGGIEYDADKGLEKPASANFHSVPANYKAMLGKKCKLYTKPRGEFVKDIAQCANLCDKHVGCKYFSFEVDSGFCTLTKECEEEVNTSTNTVVFEASKWDIPSPDPELKGIVSFGFMPEIFLRINRIGGPNMALVIGQSLQLFSYNMESRCSESSLSTKVSFLVGGNIHLKVGSSTLLQMEEYLQPIYSKSLPINGAFETCQLPEVQTPDISLPLPWLAQANGEPWSLDDAMSKTRLLSSGLSNATAPWGASHQKMLKARFDAMLKQEFGKNSDAKSIFQLKKDGNRFSLFFSRMFSWMKSKLGTE